MLLPREKETKRVAVILPSVSVPIQQIGRHSQVQPMKYRRIINEAQVETATQAIPKRIHNKQSALSTRRIVRASGDAQKQCDEVQK